MAAIVSEEALIEKMTRFEVGLAKAQQKLGIIPGSAADMIVKVLNGLKPAPSDLAEGTEKHGVPVIPFLQIIKEQLGDDSREYLHYGVTSQDVLDTSQVMILSDAITLLMTMLAEVRDNLEKLEKTYGSVKCMARTRGQLATPITFAAKINAWLQPVHRQRQRMKELSPRVLKVQLGGAAGDLAIFKSNGKALTDELASRLGLSSASSWHSQRDTLTEFSNWMAMCSGIAGKMGADILVMSQNEIGEIEELNSGGGKSSSMPHKNNPVLSEALVALARLNASLQSQMLQALVHVGERDATAWVLEWETLGRMAIYAAASLSHATRISAGMKVNTDKMESNVAAFLSKNGN
jgi:3-carboxy-cis,cis-muconate cycloisomerase